MNWLRKDKRSFRPTYASCSTPITCCCLNAMKLVIADDGEQSMTSFVGCRSLPCRPLLPRRLLRLRCIFCRHAPGCESSNLQNTATFSSATSTSSCIYHVSLPRFHQLKYIETNTKSGLSSYGRNRYPIKISSRRLASEN